MIVERLLGMILTAAVALALHEQAFAEGPVDDGIGPTAEASDQASSPSPWGWVKMPKITMPKIEFPKMPADPLAPLKTSARKVSDGSKRMFEGTKELFTGGSKAEQPAARVASQGEAPSLWQRMFGAKQPVDEGPRTIGEWQNQPRVE